MPSRRVAVATALTVALPAHAADLATRAPPPAPVAYSWTGLYGCTNFDLPTGVAKLIVLLQGRGEPSLQRPVSVLYLQCIGGWIGSGKQPRCRGEQDDVEIG